MTNEEVINELKKYTLGKKNTERVEINILKLNRIIKALKQEPCDDCVSRQAVLDACDQSINIFDATDRIKELPSVKPKIKECEDCVSREAVHNLIIPWLNDYLLDETREALETIDYKIEDLPFVTPKPKQKSEWNAKATFTFTDEECNLLKLIDVYECKNCGYIQHIKTKCCPNCEAKMEV